MIIGNFMEFQRWIENPLRFKNGGIIVWSQIMLGRWKNERTCPRAYVRTYTRRIGLTHEKTCRRVWCTHGNYRGLNQPFSAGRGNDHAGVAAGFDLVVVELKAEIKDTQTTRNANDQFTLRLDY